MIEYQSLFLLMMYFPVFIGLESLLGASRYLFLLSLSFFAVLGFYLLVGLPSQLYLFPSLCLTYVFVWLSSSIDIRQLLMTRRYQLILVMLLGSCWWTEHFLVLTNELGLTFLTSICSVSLVFFSDRSKALLKSIFLVVGFCLVFALSILGLEFGEQGLLNDSYDQIALLSLVIVSSSFLMGGFPFHYWWISIQLKVTPQKSFFFIALRSLVLYQVLSLLCLKLEAYPQLLHLLAILSIAGLVIYGLLELVEVEAFTLNIFSFNRFLLSLSAAFIYFSLSQRPLYFEFLLCLGLVLITSNIGLISRIARQLKLNSPLVLLKELEGYGLSKALFLLTLLCQLFVFIIFLSWDILSQLDMAFLAVAIFAGANSLYHQAKLYFNSTRRSSSSM